MGLFNPLHALIIPSFFLITIALAILAAITTALAFSVLLLRALVVYIDILLSLIPSRRFQGVPHRPLPRHPSSPTLTSPSRKAAHHRRRRSSASGISGGSTSSISERGLGLIPSIGAERDYEGIGGWRVGGEQDDELWTTVNPKLDRHHLRTPSGGGPTTPGEGGYLMMKGRSPRTPETVVGRTSPNSSRARTPTGPSRFTGMSGEGTGGYFALSRNTSPKAAKRYHGQGAE